MTGASAEFGLFAYPWDFDEASLRRRLELVVSLGVGRLVLAALYHDGRQLSPGGPRRIAWVRGGQSYVPVRAERYPDGLAPQPATAALGFAEIAAAARELGLEVEAWTVSLHRDDLVANPDPALPRIANAFGEHQLAWLCPSAPAVGDYLRAHVEDLAEAGADAVVLEGCYYPPLAHGYHHESHFDALGGRTAWLLSLCFCDACRALVAGIDVAAVRDEIDRALAGDGNEDLTSLAQLEPELRGLALARCDAVTALVARLAVGPVPIRYADQAVIAGPIFRTGCAGPSPAAFAGWRFGLDYAGLGEHAEAVVALGYLADLAELRGHLDAYEELGVPSGRLDVALRPLTPDSSGAAALADKIRLARAAGARRVDFYNLAFARDADLESLGRAIAEVT